MCYEYSAFLEINSWNKRSLHCVCVSAAFLPLFHSFSDFFEWNSIHLNNLRNRVRSFPEPKLAKMSRKQKNDVLLRSFFPPFVSIVRFLMPWLFSYHSSSNSHQYTWMCTSVCASTTQTTVIKKAIYPISPHTEMRTHVACLCSAPVMSLSHPEWRTQSFFKLSLMPLPRK